MQTKELDSITWKLMPPTRALQTAFTAWSKGEASESEVSDQYVRLGNEFIAARGRLAAGGLAVDDLIDVPLQLRSILEDALALDCSPAVAEQYDPQIRAVMSQLFHQLKAKQMHLAASQPATPQHPHTAPSASVSQPTAQQPPPPQPQLQQPQPPSTSSTSVSSSGSAKRPVHASHASHGRAQAQAPAHEAQRSMHYPRSRPMHGQAAYAHGQGPAMGSSAGPPPASAPAAYASTSSSLGVPSEGRPPAIPPPKRPGSMDQEDDALSLLQRHGALERQASKRYSTRQISRMVNGTAEQMSLPTSGIHRTFTPDFKESNVVKESSERERSVSAGGQTNDRHGDRRGEQSDRAGSDRVGGTGGDRAGGDRLSTDRPGSDRPEHSLRRSSRRSSDMRSPSIKSPRSVLGSPSKPLVDDFAVFLRVGNDIRKARLTKPVSIAAIRLQFVEVCAYIHSGDDTFPIITMRDPATQIDYEVTEATVGDVTEGTLLTLKVKTSEELSVEDKLNKITETLTELSSKIRTPSSAPPSAVVSGPGSTVLARGNSTKSYGSPGPSKFTSPVLTGEGRFKLERQPAPPRELPADQAEIVHREIAAIRQLSNKTIAALKGEVVKLRAELQEVGAAANNQHAVSDRRTMNTIKQQMEESTQDLISKMESLSDIIDAQRVGIGSHGVRYPQNELEKVRRQLATWSAEFEKSEQFINDEKPVWKKTWQAELNNVIEDQDWLKTLDMLYQDLRADLEQSQKTFDLVCEANALPLKSNNRQGVPLVPPIKPGEEKNVADAVFDDIKALNLNHEQRAEAVQRAERVHKAKLMLKSEEFEDELNSFVSDSKLKPNGGMEEAERRMREREQAARKQGEESEREARKLNEKMREERKAKRRGDVADPSVAKDGAKTSTNTPSEVPEPRVEQPSANKPQDAGSLPPLEAAETSSSHAQHATESGETQKPADQ